ncbi:MAG: DNA gyrase inhibitor YacG [Caulobacteraceae bacterium]
MTSPSPSAPQCPICRRPADAAYRPFCSKRCADVDLQRWLGGVYVIPGEPEEEGAAAPRSQDDEG